MKVIFKDFFQFIRKPNTNKIDFGKKAILKKIGLTLLLIPISIFIGLALKFGILFILQMIGITPPDNVSTGVATARNIFSPLMLFFQIVILGPIIEEISFRLPLKFNKLFIPFSVFVFYLMIKLLNKKDFYLGEYTLDYILLQVAISIMLFIVLFALLRIKNIRYFIEEKIYKKHFGIFFYALAFFFAFLHYKADSFSLVFVTPIIISQFISGVFLGYVRMKLGFRYGVLMHMLNNLPSAIF